MNRHGDLCSSCDNNTGPVFGSSRFGQCLPTYHSAVTRWLKFLSIQIIPSTAIFFLILFCKVRASTGPLNAFIFFSHIFSAIITYNSLAISTSFGIHGQWNGEWKFDAETLKLVSIEIVSSFYTFWYDQCAWPIKFSLMNSISPIQVLALQYFSALYPLFLILLSVTIIRLKYQGCTVLTYMWMPFQYCTSRLSVDWDPINSIIHTFATFILLSYTQIMVVSYRLLGPTRVYNQSGELPYKTISYDASIHFLSRQHLPYVLLALSMLTVFCGFPLTLLFLYPMACFQRVLNKMLPFPVRELLRTLAESYMGCYRDKTTPQNLDCRCFASFYFLFRIIYLICIFFAQYAYMWFALIIVPLLIACLFAVFQKKKWLNVVDTVAFTLAALVTVLYTYHIYVAKIPTWAS